MRLIVFIILLFSINSFAQVNNTGSGTGGGGFNESNPNPIFNIFKRNSLKKLDKKIVRRVEKDLDKNIVDFIDFYIKTSNIFEKALTCKVCEGDNPLDRALNKVSKIIDQKTNNLLIEFISDKNFSSYLKEEYKASEEQIKTIQMFFENITTKLSEHNKWTR